MIQLRRSSGRRPLWLLVVLALALFAAACGDDGDTTTSDDAATDETTTPAAEGAPKLAIVYSAEWKDGSWGEAALVGAEKLEAEGKVSEIALSENVPPGADAERALRDYADKGFNPVIAHSFNYGDDVKKVAKDYPDTLFVYAGGFGDVADNVGDYSQPFYQAAYLEGILAAGVQGSGNVAGAGGFDIPVCQAMFWSFLDGAQQVNPDTDGSFVAVGDWYDVQKAKEAALAQAADGATMYIGCGQGPTFGQIEAAKEESAVATGYVGDMSSLGDVVLTSTIWKLDAVFEQMVADVAAGTATPARYYEIGFKDGGMDIVINPAREGDIPDDVMALYEEKLAAIKDGSFEVTYKDKA